MEASVSNVGRRAGNYQPPQQELATNSIEATLNRIMQMTEQNAKKIEAQNALIARHDQQILDLSETVTNLEEQSHVQRDQLDHNENQIRGLETSTTQLQRDQRCLKTSVIGLSIVIGAAGGAVAGPLVAPAAAVATAKGVGAAVGAAAAGVPTTAYVCVTK